MSASRTGIQHCVGAHFLLWLAWGAAALAAEENLLRGKACTVVPRVPDQATTALTDGITEIDAHAFRYRNYPNPLFIFDLGKVEPLGELRLHTNGGPNAPYLEAWTLPDIDVFAGETWEQMYKVAQYRPWETLEFQWSAFGHKVISLSGLKAKGRYVALVLSHIDWAREIAFSEFELLRGEFASEAVAPAGPALTMRVIWDVYARGSSPDQIDPAVITPHVAWGKPLAGGPIRALFILCGGTERDVVEVAQRLALDYDYLLLEDTSFGFPHKSSTVNAILAQEYLQKLDKTYDVIVISDNVYWLDLPDEIRARLLEKVNAGTGLLYCHPAPDRLDDPFKEIAAKLAPAPQFRFTSPIEITTVNRLFPADTVKTGNYGKGRVLTIHFTEALADRHWRHLIGSGLLPKMEDWGPPPNRTEIYFSFLCQCIRWAGGKEGKPSITSLNPRSIEDAGLELEAIVDNAGSNAWTGNYELVLRDPDFREVMSSKGRVSIAASGKTVIPLRQDVFLRKGLNVASLALKDGEGRIIDWASTVIARNLPGIRDLLLDRPDGYAKGDTVACRLRLEAGSKADQASVELRDMAERLCDVQRLPVAAGQAEVSFAVSTKRAATVAARIRVELGQHDQALDRLTRTIGLGWNQPLRTEVFPWTSWERLNFNAPWRREYLRIAKGLGLDAAVVVTGYEDNAWFMMIKGPDMMARLAEADIRPLFQNAHGLYAMYGSAASDLFNPATRHDLTKRLMTRVPPAIQWGATDVSLGDETHMEEVTTPQALQGFRRYLRQKYGDVQTLNREWGAAYGAFEEIEPLKFTELGLDTVAKYKSIGRWLDYRFYLDQVYFAPVYEHKQKVKTIAPHLRFGLEGINNMAATSVDFWDLMQAVDYVTYYPMYDVQAHAVRSFTRKDQSVSSWVGYDIHDSDELSMHWNVWHDLIRGFNGLATYAPDQGCRLDGGERDGYNPYHRMGYIKADLSLRRWGRILEQEVAEIKGGIGPLLINARLDYDAAILFSYESLVAAPAVPTPIWNTGIWQRLGQGLIELAGVERLMTEIGLSWKYIAAQELARGILNPAAYKILVLPFCVALSEQDVAAIKEYVAAGGTLLVIGDCAVMNRNGRFYEKNPMDEALGIVYRKDPAKFPRTVAGRVDGFPLPELFVCDPDLEIATGTVAKYFEAPGGSNRIPAVVKRRIGKGSTVFLNGSLHRYRALAPRFVPGPQLAKNTPAERTARQYRGLFRQLVEDSKVEPRIKIHDPGYEESCLPYAEIADFVEGPAHYYGILEKHFRTSFYDVENTTNGPANWRTVKFELPEPGHIYDVRERKYLGFIREGEVPLGACMAKLIAALPYKIEGVALESAVKRRPLRALTYEIRILASSKEKAVHAVNLQVFDPTGMAVKVYSGPILIRDGQGRGEIVLALDDPPGKWTLKATEAVSGLGATAPVNLK